MYIDKVKYVGGLFLGDFSGEVIGEYVGGGSDVVGSNETGRFRNGVCVNEFMRRD
ncbi:histidinol dehydrogenase [Staphylococcus epidermidis]|uniref:histidinol dehydrogenase n=1 Tax=Staphylococcus epidermidis TaxID=1282 RepID=UPI0021B416E4